MTFNRVAAAGNDDDYDDDDDDDIGLNDDIIKDDN